MSLLQTARFLTTVAQLRQLPRGGAPEVAFVGRSNAGKSSAINVLCQRRRLAFASRTPGRTQALNVFALGPAGEPPVACLVDTPGYGYAAAPQALKQQWDTLAGRYLQRREQLRGVVLILDIRREVTALDEALLGWAPTGAALLVVASKCDKLNRSQQARACGVITAAVKPLRPDGDFEVLAFSATTSQGVEQGRIIIERWLARTSGPAEQEPP